MATAKKPSSGNRSKPTSSAKTKALRQVKQEQARLGARGSDTSMIGRMKQQKVDAMAQKANYKGTTPPRKGTGGRR